MEEVYSKEIGTVFPTINHPSPYNKGALKENMQSNNPENSLDELSGMERDQFKRNKGNFVSYKSDKQQCNYGRRKERNSKGILDKCESEFR